MASGWGLAAWFSRSVDGTRALCPVILLRPVPTQGHRTVSGNQNAHRDPMGVEDLLAQAKLLDQLVIFPVVFSLEVIEYLATLAHHLQQSAPRMMVLDVRLEVVGQPIYPGRKQSDLHFRGTRIARCALVLADNLRLFRNADPHALALLSLRERPAFYLEISAFYKQFDAENTSQDSASSRFGCKVPLASTCPVPRNFVSSPKTAMLPPGESTDIVRPCRNFAARGASSVRRGQDWSRASRGRSRSRRPAGEIASSASSVIDCSNANGPTAVRSSAARCAPQPRSAPISSARARM